MTTPVYSWKVLDNSPVASSRTDDIWFFDESEGWLVNSSGYVCKTSNGGSCWEPKFYLCPNSKGKPYLRCMGWGSRKVGWFGSVTGIGDDQISGPDSYLETLLHHTTDGGETWTPVTNLPRGTSAGICGFYAVNEQVAYGSGTNDPGLPGPTVIKTADGGSSWELIDMSSYADNLIDIFFFDENHGFVVGGKIFDSGSQACPLNNPAYPQPRLSRYGQVKPVVLQTRDGGQTWQDMLPDKSSFPCGEWGWKIQFLNENVGFVSLENFRDAAILKTTDGGNTWTRHQVVNNLGTVINNDLEGIGFIDENRGWVGGWGNDFNGLMNCYTDNGGQVWQSQDHNAQVAHSDPRLRINRYRFIFNNCGDVVAGYCSGLQVYRLVINGGHKKAALAADDKNALANNSGRARLEPANGGANTVARESTALQEPSQTHTFSQHNFAIAAKRLNDGKLEISYDIPQNAKNVFVGLWNQLAFYVRTLTSGNATTGRQTIVWDGLDDQGQSVGDGVYICRLSVDGREGGSEMVVLGADA